MINSSQLIFPKGRRIEQKAFTLVELIVVITIIAILSTIWFVAYSWFSSKARDSSRVAQLKSINWALESYTTRWKLPLPDDKVTIYASWTIIWYQWNAWEAVLNKIWIKEWWKDPNDDKYYTYSIDSKLKNIQLLAFLENDINEDKETTSIINNYGLFKKVNATDYTNRIARPYWSKLWILLDVSNNPIQENTNLRTSWLDIVTSTWTYKAVFMTKDTLSSSWIVIWTWIILAQTNSTSSCKRILETWWARWDWIYTINPLGTSFQVFCDMNSDWWWWTLVMKNDWDSDSWSLSNNANIWLGYNILNLISTSYDSSWLFNDAIINSLMTKQYRSEWVNWEKIYAKLMLWEIYWAKTLSSKYRSKVFDQSALYTDTSVKVTWWFNNSFSLHDNTWWWRAIIVDLNPQNSWRYWGRDCWEYMNTWAICNSDWLKTRVFVK